MKWNIWLFPKRRMIGGIARINRGWPDSEEGRLVAVKPDHLVLDTGEGGIIYCPADQVKSISISGYESQERYTVPPYIESVDFTGVLAAMKERSVEINRDGPGELRGVIGGCFPDHIVLVQDHEITGVFIRHIRSIGLAATLASGEANAAAQATTAKQAETADEAAAASETLTADQRESTAAAANAAYPAANDSTQLKPAEEAAPSEASPEALRVNRRTFQYSIRTIRTIRSSRTKRETRRSRTAEGDRGQLHAKIHIWHNPSSTVRKPSRKLSKKTKNIKTTSKLQSSNRPLVVWLSPKVTRGSSA